MPTKSIVLTATALLLFSASVCAQDATPEKPGAYSGSITKNYVRTWEAVAPETNAANLHSATTPERARMTTQYLDGLGRSLQTVVRGGSLVSGGAAVDLVSPVVYDAFGREVRQYLPYASTENTGVFKLDPFAGQQGFYADPTNSPIKGQGETFYYSKTEYEASPLNRAERTYAPGNSWVNQGKGIKMKYGSNTLADEVKIWTVTNNSTVGSFGAYAAAANPYPAGELYKTITVDENAKQVIEFKDKEGKVILKKVQLTASADDGSGRNHPGWLCTYYIYDDLGQLRAVIQPNAVKAMFERASWTLTQTELDELTFRYEYDHRGRMIMKKVPGAEKVYLVYDARDRLVLTQDGNLRAQGKWLYTLYENNLNRPAATGLWTTATSFASHLSGAAGSVAYPNLSGQPYEELTATFYDNYAWLASYGSPLSTAYDASYNAYFQTTPSTSFPYPQTPGQSALTKGLVTGSRVKVLGTTTYLYTVTFYDDKGRVIQVQSKNITGGTDVVTTQYSWAGQPLVTVMRQEKGGAGAQTTTTVTQNTYDELGRLTRVEKKLAHSNVNSGAMSAFKTVAELAYDALGQLKTKKLGEKKDINGSYTGEVLEEQRFDYNIRGWMLGANRDYAKTESTTDRYFGFDLGYDKQAIKTSSNTSLGTYATPQFGGNIAGTVWKSRGDGAIRRYDFGYDEANRLTAANFNQYTGSTNWSNTEVNFTVDNLLYDANGNLIAMHQRGLKIEGSDYVDQLTYQYFDHSNKLKSVSDPTDAQSKLGDFTDHHTSGDDYDYDENGNLTFDKNKRIASITYNHLNLPTQITVTKEDGALKGTITYRYDAAGGKLEKKTTDYSAAGKTITTTTTYLGGGVYESRQTTPADANDPDYTDQLQFLAHEEGRIRPKRNTAGEITGFEYDYFLKDHLGNVRLVLTEERQQDIYPAATLEGSLTVSSDAIYKEKEYYSIDPARVVPKTDATGITDYQNQNGGGVPPNPNPNSQPTALSQQLYKLRAQSTTLGGVTGLGITLKVMGGDRVDLFGKSYYFENNTDPTDYKVPFGSILEGLFGAPTSTAGGKTTAAAVSGVPAITGAITDFLSKPERTENGVSTTPKAFLNWILLDENFRYVNGGFDRVGGAGVVKDHSLVGIPIPKSGYLYVYASNESAVSVFFDNVQVVHTREHILEETHYYPFGGTMAGISSKAAGGVNNRYEFNGNELQNKEFNDGSGLETIDFNARMYDAQIGRFWQLDPLCEYMRRWSPYSFAFDNPIRFDDQSGRMPGDSTQPANQPALFGGSAPETDPSDPTGITLAPVVVTAKAKTNNSWSSWLHTSLDFIGVVDPFGVADGLNALMYLAEGDYRNAGLTAIAMIPFADGVKALKYVDEAAEVVEGVVKYEDEVQEIVKKTPRKKTSKQLRKEWEVAEDKSWPKEPDNPNLNQHAHHIKPLADGGIDGYPNITPLPAAEHRKLHKIRGDHKRWGGRAKPKKK